MAEIENASSLVYSKRKWWKPLEVKFQVSNFRYTGEEIFIIYTVWRLSTWAKHSNFNNVFFEVEKPD